MDREYLEDYEQRERREYERLERKIQEGKFSFEKDRYPPESRFLKTLKPIVSTTFETAKAKNLWGQIPFCGSLILTLPSYPQDAFESYFFKISDIPKIIDFIKDTGRLQVALRDPPKRYVGLDYFDPFFKELNPPWYRGSPLSIFGNKKEISKVRDTFITLGKVRYFDYLWKICEPITSRAFPAILEVDSGVYIRLKLGRYTVVEDIEDLMIDDPEKASMLLDVCSKFIIRPITDLHTSLRNFALEETRTSQALPLVYQPKELRFPYEIGKFLLRKLTYAPKGMRACNELIDHYDSYDLQKVQKSLNEAILTNHPDIVNKNADELSEILDNIWNDPTIPKRVKNLRRGIPMSIAAIGTAVSAFTGGLEGFLAGLGFSVGAKFLDAEIKGLSERIAKWLTRSYQANVYDFKKKYKHRIVSK